METWSALALTLILQSAVANEWPQWRGPGRDGVATTPAPSSWPEELTEGWKSEVGIGHSSPVTDSARVYVFSRTADREVVRSLRLTDGETLWESSYAAPYTMNPAATSHGKGPKSTPLLANGKLYTLGISGTLSCWDSTSGALVWRKDFAERFRETSPLYGSATSPMLAGGKLVVHLGGPAQGALFALEPESGDPIWAYDGDGPSYASPVVATLGGIEQVVTQTDAHIVGVALESGKLLWSLPFTTPYDQNILTPVVVGDRLVLGGLESETFAIELSTEGSTLEPRRVWSSPASFYMSTPVLVDDRLIGMSNKRRGQFVALDARTGARLWESEGRQADNASLIRMGSWILALTDEGSLFVLPASSGSFAPVRSYAVAASASYAHPVPTGDGILIKDESTLTLYRFQP